MDRKSIIIVVLCFGLLIVFNSVISKLYPPIPVQHPATNAVPALQMAGGTNVAPTAPAPVTSQSPTTTTLTVARPQLVVDTNVVEELIVVTNDNARYTFTSYGGALKTVELVHYPEAVGSRREKNSSGFATLNADSPSPVLAVRGSDTVQGDGIFQLTRTATGVRAEKTLSNGAAWVKDFSIESNYLVAVDVHLLNTSTQALAFPEQEWVVGVAAPMNAQDNGQAVGMMWFNGQKTTDIVGAGYFATKGFGCVPRVPPLEYRGGQSPVVWAAAHNQFFALVLIPSDPAADVVVRRLDMPRPTGDEARFVDPNAKPPQGYETVLVYPAIAGIAPGTAVQHHFKLFAGPKEYRTLAAVAAKLNNNVDTIMGFGSIWGFFAKALLLSMNWLHEALRLPYGWTIVGITVLIKVIFWPLTAASTRSMKRMQALQPQIKAIQEKYKEDPMKVHRKTMDLWKENKVSPVSGCLPMLIQMPVFIGFITMVRSAIELRGASFLWIADLSRPDTLFIIPGVGIPFNLLPLIMVGTMLWQSHIQPTSPGVDPTQQKMMRYLPLIFLVILYNYSAGMALYWTTNNLLTIVQTKLTKTQPLPTPAPAALTPPQKKRK